MTLAKVKKEKHQAERMCVSCREMEPKQDLFRIVVQDGEAIYDETGKLSGRGAYVSKKEECIKVAFSNKKINRSLKMNPANSLEAELLEELVRLEELSKPKEKRVYKIKSDGSIAKK